MEAAWLLFTRHYTVYTTLRLRHNNSFAYRISHFRFDWIINWSFRFFSFDRMSEDDWCVAMWCDTCACALQWSCRIFRLESKSDFQHSHTWSQQVWCETQSEFPNNNENEFCGSPQVYWKKTKESSWKILWKRIDCIRSIGCQSSGHRA